MTIPQFNVIKNVSNINRFQSVSVTGVPYVPPAKNFTSLKFMLEAGAYSWPPKQCIFQDLIFGRV